MLNRGCWAIVGWLVAGVSTVLSAAAQKVYTRQDYTQAERWMFYNVDGLVHHTIRGVTYLPDGHVFYRDPGAQATMYRIADPAHQTVVLAFDNQKLAAALDAAMRAPKHTEPAAKVDPNHLDIQQYAERAQGGFSVTTDDGVFDCDEAVKTCTEQPKPPSQTVSSSKDTPRHADGEANLSPDGKLAAFIRDNNLWVRVVATGQERQLTTDGAPDFGYATDNAGWQHSDRAILTWSADSRKIATFQQDQRKTGFMYLVPVSNRHPKLEAWRYPLVGDKDVTMIQPVVIDVATAKVVRLKTPPLEHRSMECDDVSCDGDGRWSDVEFSPHDARLAFVSTSRDHKDEWVEMADTATGDVKPIYHEHVDTYYGWQATTDWKVLWSRNQFLWASERSNWAQYYLYNLSNGALVNQVTQGEGPVAEIKAVDEKSGVLWFTATNKIAGQDPYYVNYFRVNLDGSQQRLLTPEDAYHKITAPANGSTFVDVYSTVSTPQTAVLRDGATGKVLVVLAHQDISQLLAAGWKPPLRIQVSARDGVTPLYGLLFRPTDFDPARKYPVIDYVYPGPQDGSCSALRPPDFAAARGDLQSMAQLGFVVVCIDGMGNPHRSKSFHDAYASNPADMGEDTIPDQVAGIKDLAARYAWIDLNHVGITGHSGGGNATVSAMFHFPDFFSVGWAESGNHDQREYEDDWDERWAGLETIGPDGADNYSAQANQKYAANLKGHLMLVHGTMDDNVPPNNTLLVVNALIQANKNFDMLMLPNMHHGYAKDQPYVMRRKWDYFVKHLAGGVPPTDFVPTPYDQVLKVYRAEH
ncbi:MAG: DPP IV N-terminal domain-containing protein [Acidobacteriaceae bacterium]